MSRSHGGAGDGSRWRGLLNRSIKRGHTSACICVALTQLHCSLSVSFVTKMKEEMWIPVGRHVRMVIPSTLLAPLTSCAKLRAVHQPSQKYPSCHVWSYTILCYQTALCAPRFQHSCTWPYDAIQVACTKDAGIGKGPHRYIVYLPPSCTAQRCALTPTRLLAP